MAGMMCCQCRNAVAEICWSIRQKYGGSREVMLCANCAKWHGLTLLREVAALKVGRENAEKVYTQMIRRYVDPLPTDDMLAGKLKKLAEDAVLEVKSKKARKKK